MRKSLLMAAVAALVLAGCSQDDVVNSSVDQNNGTPIDFRIVTNKTRATESMNSESIGDFRVSANKSGSNEFDFMKDVAVIKTDDKWSYAPLKFFPSDGTVVDFYAYSPSGSVNVIKGMDFNINDGVTLGYRVPEVGDRKKAEDFLIASTSGNSGSNAVVMDFRHALSMATFAAKNASVGMTLIVDRITLSNLGHESTLSLTSGGTFTWGTPVDQMNNYELNLPVSGVPVLANGDYQSLLPEEEGLMILPQTKGTSNIELTVDYTAVDADNVVIGGDVATFTLENSFVFEMGKKYTFNFTFKGAFDPIEFENVVVEHWDDSPHVDFP